MDDARPRQAAIRSFLAGFASIGLVLGVADRLLGGGGLLLPGGSAALLAALFMVPLPSGGVASGATDDPVER